LGSLCLSLSGQLNPEGLGSALPNYKDLDDSTRGIAANDADQVSGTQYRLAVYGSNDVIGLQSCPRCRSVRPHLKNQGSPRVAVDRTAGPL